MPLERDTPPAAEDPPQRPGIFFPALIPGIPVVLFLLSLWWLGTRYELHPPSEFRAENVIQPLITDSSAAQLRARAGRLEQAAAALEQRAFANAAWDTAARPETARANLYRVRADSLTSRAGVRDGVLAQRHGRRLLWIYALSVDVVVCVLAGLLTLALTFGALLSRRVPRRRALRALATMLALAVPAALLFWWSWYDHVTPPYALVRTAVGDEILDLLRAVDGLHILIVTLIMLAGAFLPPSAALRRTRRAPVGSHEIAGVARELAEGNRLFRIVLYIAASMLVVYVAAVSSFFHWVLAFVNPDKPVFAAVEGLTNSAVTARGLLASGILVFGFGLAALIGRATALNLAQSACPDGSPGERQTWIAEQGLVPADLRQQLKTVAAVLAPLATGVLAQVLTGLL
jgi:hypothetical protein